MESVMDSAMDSTMDAQARAGKRAAGQAGEMAAGASGSSTDAAWTTAAMEEHLAWPMISRLPVTLVAKIPLSHFTVRDLLTLRSGQTIGSAWSAEEDVPLKVGELQLSWSEFELMGERLALRLTRLA